ncbi:MAG TPA: SagB/ThcOx family dehydrogenase [Chroococcidiopsis sp.]
MSDVPFSIAQHYHERTKYSAASIAQNASRIDPAKQPIPFKEYKIGTIYDLKPYLGSRANATDADEAKWRRLSRLFYCSYGLTLKLITGVGDAMYLRAAPSAGGLYPAEIYLISRGTPFLSAGLYHYQPQSHSLVQFWDSHVWTTLQQACGWHSALDSTQLALVTTAVFFRSSWRYQDRAYRRILLDTGHLLGNVELAGAANDFRPHLIGGFCDQAVNGLLYLDPEKEGAIAVMALADLLDVQENLPLFPTVLPSATQAEDATIPDGELLAVLHHATSIEPEQDIGPSSALALSAPEDDAIPTDKYNFPFCLKVPTATAPLFWGDGLVGLENTILKRRSTREYTGASLSLEELKLLLDFTYQPQHYFEQGLDRTPDFFDLSLIQTFVVSSGVNDLEEGCYYYAPKAEELRQIRFKNFRDELHRLCLWQDLGRDAGAVLFHTADLKQAIAKYGDRAYRYLHMDAGHLGQRLNLAAIYLGLGVSGIGGFFDDEVNEVLGIPEDEAVLYITTLGRPS